MTHFFRLLTRQLGIGRLIFLRTHAAADFCVVFSHYISMPNIWWLCSCFSHIFFWDQIHCVEKIYMYKARATHSMSRAVMVLWKRSDTKNIRNTKFVRWNEWNEFSLGLNRWRNGWFVSTCDFFCVVSLWNYVVILVRRQMLAETIFIVCDHCSI